MGGTDASDRLLLRVPRLSDASELMRFLGDAEAMRYTFHFNDLRACRRHIAAHECQRRKLGYGPWTIIERASGQVVGFGGLADDPFDPGWGIEIVYHFAPLAWGKGYATELTRYCLMVAAERLRVPEISAFAHPDNAASRRVLIKSGFVQRRLLAGMNRYLYVRTLAAVS